jgi:flagellar hook-length control protein FliK
VTSSVQITTANAEPTPDLDALAVSVAARAMSGAKQFEIRLDPPELGRVDVRLSIDAGGKTQAHMTADHPQTLDLLQKDATNLTQALRDAGLDVSQDGLNFSLRGQDRQSDDSNNGAGPGRRTNLIASRAILAVQSPSAISFNGAAANARVDIHV